MTKSAIQIKRTCRHTGEEEGLADLACGHLPGLAFDFPRFPMSNLLPSQGLSSAMLCIGVAEGIFFDHV